MDHILFSNRSQIHSSLKHYEKALRDADMACRLKPHWSKVWHNNLRLLFIWHNKQTHDKQPTHDINGNVDSNLSSLCSQGHVRKAQSLVTLGRTEEALREYLVCLSIEPDCRLAKTEAHKVNIMFIQLVLGSQTCMCTFNIFFHPTDLCCLLQTEVT